MATTRFTRLADASDTLPGAPGRARAETPHWLVRQRVAVPELPARYCRRPELVSRCLPAGRRATVLVAPGGFGKTTLLADCCAEAARAGVPVAWLTVADDAPAALDTYVAFAFQQAGLDLLSPMGGDEEPPGSARPRIAAAFRALDALDRPCVLALDELECAADPASVALLNDLLGLAPPCLHLALAYRSLPRGLDAVAGLLAAGAEVVTARDLRFSRGDIARFFDLALSRRELAAVVDESAGWPIALQMRRNAPVDPAHDEALVVRDAIAGWMVGRFWRGFGPADRERVLDLSLLDWIDADLLDEVLEEPGAFERATILPGLAGLLRPGRGAAGAYRLHPLVREHCAEQLRRERPDRYRAIHRRIAFALARRGATVEAMRHATEAGDGQLAGTILLDAGGLQWWLREGSDRLAAACRYLTDGAVAAQPRLTLMRCIDLLFEGRLADATRTFDASPPALPDQSAFALDRLLAKAFLVLNGSRTVTEAEWPAMAADAVRLAALPTTWPEARGALVFGMALLRARAADFDAALALANHARALVVGRSTFVTLVVDSLLGQVAMARGRVREAAAHYRRARLIASERFLEDPRMGSFIEVLAHELALERNRLASDVDARRMAREVSRTGGMLVHYAAAADLAVELAAERHGTETALAVVSDLEERANSDGLKPLRRFLAALRVSVLADAGRTDDADEAWATAELPDTDAACLDLAGRGWREVEALACARIRLRAARGDAAAADLERALAAQAEAFGLQRTLMRALALRVRLRHEAGDPDAARDAAAEYLRHFAHADYARPLLRVGTAATAALERVRDTDPTGPVAATAGRILGMAAAATPTDGPRLDDREMAVLRQLASRRDKEIARALGLSVHGVRYHVRRIFRKLDVGHRRDAVRRARALGILPPGDGPPGPP